LLDHQPAGDIQHDDGRCDNDESFHQVVVIARIEDGESPGGDDAGRHSGQSAKIERLDAMS